MPDTLSTLPNELTEFVPENVMTGICRSWELKADDFDDCIEIRNVLFSRRMIAAIVALLAWMLLILGVGITMILLGDMPTLGDLPQPLLKTFIIAFFCLAGFGAIGIFIALLIYTTLQNASLWKDGLRFQYHKSSGKLFFPREHVRYARNDYDQLILGTTKGYNTVESSENQRHRKAQFPFVLETYFLIHRKDGTWVRHLIAYDALTGVFDRWSKATHPAVVKIQESLQCQLVKRTMSLSECRAAQHPTTALN